jgi:hypothetical protein
MHPIRQKCLIEQYMTCADCLQKIELPEDELLNVRISGEMIA